MHNHSKPVRLGRHPFGSASADRQSPKLRALLAPSCRVIPTRPRESLAPGPITTCFAVWLPLRDVQSSVLYAARPMRTTHKFRDKLPGGWRPHATCRQLFIQYLCMCCGSEDRGWGCSVGVISVRLVRLPQTKTGRNAREVRIYVAAPLARRSHGVHAV